MRKDEKRTSKRVLEWKPIGRRIRGRPRKRWIEDIEEDIQMKGIRGWRKLSKERTEWRRITEKDKPIVGCNASKRRRRTTILIIAVQHNFRIYRDVYSTI
jgi:hypothetical protein